MTTRPAEAGMLTTFPSRALAVAALRRELGALEDQAAATGWAWDAMLSLRVDALLEQIEGRRI